MRVDKIECKVNTLEALSGDATERGVMETEREWFLLKLSPEQPGKMEPELNCFSIESSSSAGTDVEAPKQPRLSHREVQTLPIGDYKDTDAGGLEHGDISPRANVGVKPDKTIKLAALRQIIILQMCWLQGEVRTSSEQRK